MNETKTETAAGRLVQVHPAWFAFIRYCESLGQGEIHRLVIQDGLPAHAEEVKKTVAFKGGLP